MKNFSNIENNLITEKDSLCEAFALESGLPKDLVYQMYDNYQMMDDESPKKKFNNMLGGFGNSIFEKAMEVLLNALKNASKQAINSFIISLLNKTSENDTIAFFKIILWVLLGKDETNFVQVAKNINIDEKLTNYIKYKTDNLFESFYVDNDVNRSQIPLILGLNDGCEIQDDIEFYGNLKTILARNNKRWGHNYHLDNVYDTICKYLDSEIEYLTNKNLVTSSDTNYYNIILKELLNGSLNPMYRDINNIRHLVVDIQTFNFDLMVLITYWVKSQSHIAQYISRREYDEFIKATTNLYAQISTSVENSRVIEKQLIVCNSGGSIQGLNVWKSIEPRYDLFDFNIQPLPIKSVVDMLYIIKSCSVDYNLTIRPYLRNFVTHGLNLVGRIEQKIIEHGNINKYKN